MPRRNKIELQGLVDRIISMYHEDKMSQRDIAQELKDDGYDVSKSGVGRTLLDYASQMKTYKEAAAEAAAIVKELKNESGLDIAETTAQMLQVKMLSAIKSVSDEELDDMELTDLFNALSKNTLSQVRIAKIKLEYAKGYKAGLMRAAGTVESEGKKSGWTNETINNIKRLILDLPVEHKNVTG